MERDRSDLVRGRVFPLPTSYFAPVQLTLAHAAQLEASLHAQLQDALRVYHENYANGFAAVGGDRLDAPWKYVGSVGRLKTYKVAGMETSPTRQRRQRPTQPQNDVLAPLGHVVQSYRTSGKIQGFYKDILRVHHTENSLEFLNQQTLLYPDTVDAAVLHTMRSTPDQEQYFGIKWAAMTSPSPDIGHRDYCYVEMLGYTVDFQGKEIGFSVSASVDIPECPNMFATNHVTRVRMRNTMLIIPTQDAQSTSEIFVMGVKEVVDSSLGTNAHHRHFMAILSDMSLVIDSHNITQQSLIPTNEWVPDRDRVECNICCRKFNFLFRRKHHCRLCGEVICRTCLVKRSIPSARGADDEGKSFPSPKHSIATEKFCVRCVMSLRAIDRRRNNFTQQVFKVNSLRQIGRDSSISSELSAAVPAHHSSEKSIALSGRSSSWDSANSSARGSSISYYKRGSSIKKILRLEDLIKFPVNRPQGTGDDDNDEGDEDARYDDVFHVDTKKMTPVRLATNDKSMMELYSHLVRLSQSSGSGRGPASGNISEIRQSIASQELLLQQIRQSLVST
uniref:FYVE-type domain-containing protein n=1 Tax=Globisporangium ultimum (strain ATCC 200006 / CBS 805.95 / DAOM BR144) TaxID=431595 RepID=K3X083_GLOUD